jgi:hypothetical protein
MSLIVNKKPDIFFSKSGSECLNELNLFFLCGQRFGAFRSINLANKFIVFTF